MSLLVREVRLPSGSRIQGALDRVDFSDAYEAPLRRSGATAQELFVAIFAHPPAWVSGLMKLRGCLVAPLGLRHGDVAEDAGFVVEADRLAVGARIGMFEIQFVDASEIILGEDDRHLDFRVSVFRHADGEAEKVTVSTIVRFHRPLGRAYFAIVAPFHRRIVRAMLRRAVDANRL